MTTKGVPTILGIPFDAYSSYLRGAAEAPARIREALGCCASNQWTELGVDLGAAGAYEDAGDVACGNFPTSRKGGEKWGTPKTWGTREAVRLRSGKARGTPEQDAFAAIGARVDALIAQGKRPVALGGDHSITYPIVKAFARHFHDLTIFHFDAHPDLYDEFEGNRLSHACQFARIMEAGLVKRLVQVGIRTATGHQREQAERFGVEVVEMRSLPGYDRLQAAGPVYVSFDMDVLDPAFAPGVSHREPGGMAVREAIAHLHAIRGEIVGADVVEFNPVRDVGGVTATVTAKMVKEILGKMLG